MQLTEDGYFDLKDLFLGVHHFELDGDALESQDVYCRVDLSKGALSHFTAHFPLALDDSPARADALPQRGGWLAR